MFDWLDWFDGDIGIEEWMFIGPFSEELADDERERRRLEDKQDQEDEEW